MPNTLSLADLESFDPQAPRREGERRFLCPLCGDDKPKNAAHRSFCLNSKNGLYHCKRCKSKGLLKEFWPEKSKVNRTQMATQNLRRAFDIAPVAHNLNEKTDWIGLWEQAEVIEEARGGANWMDEAMGQGRGQGSGHAAAVRYLIGRGISLQCAHDNEVRFVPSWYGRPTLGFPFKDATGKIVAISGRALRDGGLDKPASGPKKAGAFWAGALGFGALDAALPAIILCEAPFDALSLSMAGYPALALGGTTAPTWLHQKCAFRRVLLAFDADEAGDNAALKIGAHLSSFGATCYRLCPQNAKDWNELLQKNGIEAIEAVVAPIVCEFN